MREPKEDLLDFIGYHEKWHGNVQKQTRKPYSFNQNDFLIEEIFKRIGVEKGFFVEFGAWDGIKGSNTRKLYLEGWKGILIEPEKQRFANLKKNYEMDKEMTVLNCFIDTGQNLFDDEDGENLFDDVVAPYVKDKINFCSIDVDGLDLEIFETFKVFLPDVVCIEGGQLLSPLYKERLPVSISKNNIQQGIYVMNEAFENKGYKLLCTFQDSFFIKKEYYHLFNTKDDLFELYLDGLLAYPRLTWLKQKLYENNLKNEIIDLIFKTTQNISLYDSSEQKEKWVDENYKTIKETIEKIRTKYLISKDKNNKI